MIMKNKELLERSKKFMESYKGLKEHKELDGDFKQLLQQPVVPHLRERKIGKYEIKIEIIHSMKEVTVVSARNWLLMGYKQMKVMFESPRPLYKLLKDGQGLLMSDSPQEIFLQYDAYKQAKGKVLIAGLGLGMSPTLFAEKKEVSEVIVVEIEKDIIKLCKPKNKKIRIVNDDIWKFLKETKEKFDFIYIDIHYSTGCMEYVHTVLPMKKILKERFPNTSSCFWGEEEMESQYNPNFDIKNGV